MSAKDKEEELLAHARRILQGGQERYHQQNAQKGKYFVRERLRRLLDPGSPVVEDGLYARALDPSLPADAVVTGIGRIHGRPVAFMASDSTVKAGSWGSYTVEKILRIQETAERLRIPMLYLMDSAGARIPDQLEMFPGRRHAGRIFYQQVRLSGQVPQVAILFGPSPAGAAYVPAFCDVTIMVEGNANASLGSPRMAEMVIGEKVTLEEMGGARMHCTQSGLGDFLAQNEDHAMDICRRYLAYMPQHFEAPLPRTDPRPPRPGPSLRDLVPSDPAKPFDMRALLERVVDEDSFLEVKELYAPELITGLARIQGQVVAILANQPRVKGGTLFADSADKGARFVWLANAFGLPLLFFLDVPGFMIGSRVEQAGIIRHGAKMVAAVSEATVPKVAVIVRKAYGAGLYAMAGPAFEPDAVLALPTAEIAVMGPEAAVNAVHYGHIQNLSPQERARFVAQEQEAYRRDIDLLRVASHLIVDHVVPFDELRDELVRRLEVYRLKDPGPPVRRRNPVHPV
jgi:acetyl-CoA carboxylase carboxyltransferase component